MTPVDLAHLSATASSPGAAGDERLAAILDAYVGELERGVAPAPAEVVARHADLSPARRAELADCLEGVVAIHRAVDRAKRREPAGEAADAAAPRETLGDYRLLREIGRGGMGVVYEAEERSLGRRVALKALPFAAVLDERKIARFQNEARAAAQLHHPHIVPIFAIGQERGVHYYAMQMIEGQSLAEAITALSRRAEGGAAADSEASTRSAPAVGGSDYGSTLPESGPRRPIFESAARIAADAADALHHAHEYGVVHRDVKPSNLLLDQAGKVWVADFGLARMQTDLGVTHTGDVVGTLRYMSPEQARGGADRIDGRTDVYSLGATLYELLTLRHAHLGEDRRAMLEWIDRSEPIRPRRINPAIPTDLENIVLRAMEKDPAARYASAGEMASDLRRFLDGRPTIARPPSLVRVATKWLARRRRLVGVAAAAFVAVAVVSITAAGLLWQANTRIAAALRVEQAAKEKALEVVDRFGAELSDQLAVLPGSEAVRDALVSDTLAFYRDLANDLSDHPDFAAALAVAQLKAATTAERLGRTEKALEAYALASEAFRKRLESATDEEEIERTRRWLGRSENNRGCLLRQRGDRAAAATALDESVRIFRELEGSESAIHLAEALTNRALCDAASEDRDGCVDRLKEALALLDEAPADPRTSRHNAAAYNALSLLLRRDRPEEALAASGEAIDRLRRLVAEDPVNDALRGDLAMCANNRGAIHGDRGAWPSAVESYRTAADEYERIARRSPAAPRHRGELAVALSNLALAQSRAGDAEAAERSFGRATRTLVDLVRDFPQDGRYARSLAALWNNRGVALRDAGRLELSVEAFTTAIAIERRRVDAQPGSPTLLATHYANQAQVLGRLGRDEEAAAAQANRVAWEDRP